MMALSFLKGRKIAAPPKMIGGKKGDPMVAAKAKIVAGIENQKNFVNLTASGQSLPRGKGGRMMSTWFYREMDGSYWTTLRYGQIAIPLDGEKTAVSIGKIEEMPAFYDAVTASIHKGELDPIISDLQKKRSESLKGVKRSPRKRAGAE